MSLRHLEYNAVYTTLRRMPFLCSSLSFPLTYPFIHYTYNLVYHLCDSCQVSGCSIYWSICTNLPRWKG